MPADFDPTHYDVPGIQQIDLMEIADQDRFDRIYASHVMEHVPDDSVVLNNLRRALKPGGEAWLLVPLWERPTEDGPPDLDPRERERRFGQWDHVRQYGPDFADRIAAAGFTVEVIGREAMPGDAPERMGLADTVFRARRGA
ncbi:methyltransferase domain-containing protein [Mycobacterium sp. AMU20-3851]|uniref:methyltransferase domain-containing protein n=1 Tax=Mycobacterium sp. AMU20-3851 TaxID=3122055 RepID=UPI003755379F